MIEQKSSQAAPGSESAEPGQSDTFETRPIGEYLRRQRELRGMSTEELAAITRIPLRSLERLESGQFDGETDGFVRGFVRTVANALGLDADDAISRILLEPTASSWEQRSAGRSARQGLFGLILLLFLVAGFLVLRTGWYMLRGETSALSSREVVVWHDPVRALAEATGVRLDPSSEIDPKAREATESTKPISRSASASSEDRRVR